MDKLVFSGEGWPLTQEALKQIETAYKQPLDGLTKALGDNLILTGLEDDGNGGLTAGYIVFNGELLPFQAGDPQNNAVIIEETFTANYDNNGDGVFGTNAPVWKRRYAKFAAAGSGVANIDFSSLRRYRSSGLLLSGEIVLNLNSSYTVSGDLASITVSNETADHKFFNVDFNTVLPSTNYAVQLLQKRNSLNHNNFYAAVSNKSTFSFDFALGHDTIDMSVANNSESFDVRIVPM